MEPARKNREVPATDLPRDHPASSRRAQAVITHVKGMDRACAHLEIAGGVDETFRVPDDPLRYVSARIWHCRFRSLSGLGRLRNLRKLEVAGYPDASLDPLRGLGRLEHLSMVHLPAVTSLEPLSSLGALRRLTLAALPAWNPASRPVEVESLTPLSALPALEEVNLFGVRPADRSVKVLWRIPSLRRARLAEYPERRHLSVELPDRW
jgi:hypothetical protein